MGYIGDNLSGMNVSPEKFKTDAGCVYFSLKIIHLLNSMRKNYTLLKHKLYTLLIARPPMRKINIALLLKCYCLSIFER